MAGHWMQNAVKPSHEGKFSAKAKRAGESTAEYAHEKEHASGTLGKEARLALVFAHHRPGSPNAHNRLRHPHAHEHTN